MLYYIDEWGVNMEVITCYTSSLDENGTKIYNMDNGKKVEYHYINLSDLKFTVIENNISKQRHLVLLEKSLEDDNLFTTKYGYLVNVNCKFDNDRVELSTNDNKNDVISMFPFEDIGDISCGSHYTENDIELIYNIANCIFNYNDSNKIEDIITNAKYKAVYEKKYRQSA